MTYQDLPTVFPNEAVESDWGNQVKANFENIGALFDFDSEVTGVNLALTSSFQTALTLAFTPPASWVTYKAQVDVWAEYSGLTSGDNVQIAAQGPGGTGDLVTSDAASTYRSLRAYLKESGISGASNWLLRTRNNTASRGNLITGGASIVAVRLT